MAGTLGDIPEWYVTVGNLRIHPTMLEVVNNTVCRDTGFSSSYFWACLERLTEELRPEVEQCLAKRDELQEEIDRFYESLKVAGTSPSSPEAKPLCKAFLEKIGYIEPDQGPVNLGTQAVDAEIARIPAPQLVVPADNDRFVVEAVNARWGSLFEALGDLEPASSQAAVHSALRFANALLDEIAPLSSGSWSEVTRLWPRFVGQRQQLELQLSDGRRTGLKTASLFVGSAGSLGPPGAMVVSASSAQAPSIPDKGRIILKHHGLHMILEIDRLHPVGAQSLSGIRDISMECALTCILDMEDSVSVVDPDEKARVYRNICNVMRGTMEVPLVKGGQRLVQRANPDIRYRDIRSDAQYLAGRGVALVRNVGHHLFTDAVVTADGRMIPENFLDCLVTVAAALQDLRATGDLVNSRTGSVYIVMPKMHGPREVALAVAIFRRVETYFALRQNTVKLGLLNEERRTSLNLRECIREASERVFFIGAGTLDRMGDEIHTCMMAGPVVRRSDMRQQSWMRAFEESNVDVGLFSGFQGKAQIGKELWVRPDWIHGILQHSKDAGMASAGASTAWVQTPVAAVLYSLHYHRVDVPMEQMQLSMRPPASVDNLLTLPLLTETLSKEEIMEEVQINAHIILTTVTRWVEMGIGRTKIPNPTNVAVVEDRATLRVSSQLLANWMQHKLITEQDLKEAFKESAKKVDERYANDPRHKPMSGDLEQNIPFQTAMELVVTGKTAPCGYTWQVLREARRKLKGGGSGRMSKPLKAKPVSSRL